MQAVAHVLGLLQRLWKAGPSSVNAMGEGSMDKFFDRFGFLLMTMIVSFGSIPFTEKLLLKTADERFQAANTPTHRPWRANTSVDSPILHLLRLMSDVSGVLEPTASYFHLINDTLDAACKGRMSRGSRLELLRQCADLYPTETELTLSIHNFAQVVWKLTAKLAADSLCSYPIESARERDGSVSRDYENAIRILSAGLKFSDTIQEWNQLLDSFVRVVRNEKGDHEIAMMAVEPLSECMMVLKARDTYLPVASLFGHSLSITYCQSSVREVEGTVIGHSNPNTNVNPVFPIRLVGLVNRILQESYDGFDPTVTNGIADFLESFTSFLGSGVSAFRSAILETIQQTLTLWLKDEVHKLNVESGVESRILTAGRALSSAVLNILQACSPHNASCLQRFEPILCAGLESSHISIAKRFFDFWNSSFGLQRSIVYPESISRALQRLESQIKLQNSRQLQQQAGLTPSLESQESNGNRVDMSEKSRIAFILDKQVEPSYPIGFNSSPVTRLFEASIAERPNEPRLSRSAETDKTNQIEVEDASIPFLPPCEEPQKRSDVFSMIENLRSSSPPTNTPRELGFVTPPHLRGLHAPDRESGTPRTPTLPPVTADNEDGFLGSSPTPTIRGRAHSAGSEIHSSLATPAMNCHVDSDIPSSPPELKSQGGTPRNKFASIAATAAESRANKKKKSKKSKRSLSSKDKKRPNSQTEEYDEVHEDASRAGTPLSSRLRSSTGKTSKAIADTKIEPQPNDLPMGEPELAADAPNTNTVSPTKDVSSKSTPRKVSATKGTDEITNDPHTVSDWIGDSFSDDMETQVASQLEQDLEFAVDSDKPDSEQAMEPQSEPPMTRKRKREEENALTPTPSKDERRRSTRRSTKEVDGVDLEDPRSTRSKKLMTTGSTQHVDSSPVLKRQKRQSKDDADDAPASPPDLQQDDTTTHMDAESWTASQKRRSSRLSGHAPPVIREESPAPKKSPPRSSRSRKRNTKRKGNASKEPQPPRPEVQTEETQDYFIEQNSIQESAEPELAEKPAPAPTNEQEPPTNQTDIEMEDADADPNPQTRKRALSRTTQTETAPETDCSSSTGIISSFRTLLDDIKSATLDREAIRQIDDLMFAIRVETGEALKRHTV
ncbi:hypothetical protein BBP40_008132 [Aspergillus hancockii]|nr:hypothetical protein BBP40_008132 [Aspergillus hancockii]